MIVYVGYDDLGYDGYSMPYVVFLSEEKAQEWTRMTEDGGWHDPIRYYEELEVQE